MKKRSRRKAKRKSHRVRRKAAPAKRNPKTVTRSRVVRTTEVMKTNPKRKRKAAKRRNPVRKVHRNAKRRTISARYTAIRTGSKYKLCRISGSALTAIGTYSMAGLRAWCKKHGVKCS